MLWSAEKELVEASAISRVSVIPFTLGLLKYAMLADKGLAEQPEKIVFADRFIQVFAFSWLVLFLL
jgi:decaprenyl-phosphate phosphoribosyltransferase